MSINVTLTPITSGYNLSKINNNFLAIENALQDGLSRSGITPNVMQADLDMNSNDVINIGITDTDRLIVNGVEIIGSVLQLGYAGWSPVFALITDTTRRVLQLVDWAGGGGTKPTAFINQYIGATGFTSVLANAVDIRGAQGASGAGSGDMLAAQNLNDVVSKSTAFANIKQTGTSSVTGVLQLATTVEATTGTDTAKAITAAGLAAGLAAQLTTVNASIASSTAAAKLSAQNSVVGVNTQTGTTYTFVLADAGKIVEANNASAVTFTIPPNASVAFPLNTIIQVTQYGAGQLALVAGTGVTIRSVSAKLKLTGQYSGATLYQRATNEWMLVGDITT